MAGKRRRKAEGADEATKSKCVSLTVTTIQGIQAEADKQGITFSYHLERICKAYLQRARKLTTD